MAGETDVPDQPFRQLGVFAQREGHVLVHVDVRQEGAVLEQHAPAGGGPRLLVLDALAHDGDFAAGRFLQAQDAPQEHAERPFEVVLMDVQMPEMDGLEATRRIQAEWPPAERPCLVAMTASALQGDREMCLNAGMNDYVSKPIDSSELLNVLKKNIFRR